MGDIPKVITRSEVATMLCTSERHVRRMADDGRLPYLKVGGKQRFVYDDIIEFINASKVHHEGTPS